MGEGERGGRGRVTMRPEEAAAWVEGINRRIAAYDRGVPAVDAATSLAQLREKPSEFHEALGH